MNKRIKKKHHFEIKVAQLVAENALLMEAVKRHTKLIEELYETNSRNVKAANKRFDKLEDEIKALKNTQKKSWFGRK